MKEGDTVTKGAPLFSYDTDEIQMKLSEAELELERINTEISTLYSQIETLQNEKAKAPESEAFSYTTQILTAQNDVKRAEYNQKSKGVEIEQIRKSLENSTITSEIDGVVKSINDGSQASYGYDNDTSYMTILSNNEYRIKGTINEQNMLTLVGPVIGTLHLPEGCTNEIKEIYQQNHHMLVAQAKAMALCHEMIPGAKIGPAPNISLVYPASCKPEDVLAAQNYNAIRNWLYLDMAVYGVYNNLVWAYLEEHDACPTFAPGDAEALKNGHPDFIGFNYYNTATCEASDGTETMDPGADQQTARGEAGFYRGFKNPNLPTTEFGWEIDPMGFRATIREMYSRYRLPMIVTENGLGAYDKLTEDGKVHDQYRIEYLRKHLEQVQLAITDGCEMMGYCPWSAVDLISTHEGMVKRYGFIYVDREEFDLKTLDRYRKDSFYWYKKVIATNGDDLSD